MVCNEPVPIRIPSLIMMTPKKSFWLPQISAPLRILHHIADISDVVPSFWICLLPAWRSRSSPLRPFLRPSSLPSAIHCDTKCFFCFFFPDASQLLLEHKSTQSHEVSKAMTNWSKADSNILSVKCAAASKAYWAHLRLAPPLQSHRQSPPSLWVVLSAWFMNMAYAAKHTVTSIELLQLRKALQFHLMTLIIIAVMACAAKLRTCTQFPCKSQPTKQPTNSAITQQFNKQRNKPNKWLIQMK